MTEQEILQKIQQAFKVSFGTAPEQVVAGAMPNEIPGWDSLGHAVLASNLEHVFSVTFDIDELMAMEDVSAIIEVMKNKAS